MYYSKKSLFSKYKSSEIENYYSSISIRKIDSRRRKKKKKTIKWCLFSQILIDKFQMEFLHSLDHTNGKIRRPNCPRRMESRAFNFRIFTKCSPSRVCLPTSSTVVNRWLNFISPNENCSFSASNLSIIRPDRGRNVTEQSVLSLINYPSTRRREEVKKKLKVDSKSTETIRPNLLVVFAIFPETTNVERIETGDRSIESNSHSSSFFIFPEWTKN